MNGIDVSSHNGNMNWNKVVKDGIECALIRVGIGGNYKSQDDIKAEYNMKECERLGIPYGVYIYSYALNEDMAKSEAEHALRMIGNHKPTLGIWIDMEDADYYKKKHGINVYKSRDLLTNICKLFCDIVSSKGFVAGVYASRDYWKNVLYQDKLSSFKVWLAHWNISEPSMECDIWQYSDKGVVAGNGGSRMDMDIVYIDKFTQNMKTNKEIAQEVINGLWGNGDERKNRLKEAGYNYSAVQRIVNSMLK